MLVNLLMVNPCQAIICKKELINEDKLKENI
jgi:hypothetical protein